MKRLMKLQAVSSQEPFVRMHTEGKNMQRYSGKWLNNREPLVESEVYSRMKQDQMILRQGSS
jgi:hypothetical protein